MEQPPIDAPVADWLVFGDALQEAGDPRGTLIGLSHAIDEGRTPADEREGYLRQHAAALLGRAAPHLDRYVLTWRFSEIIGAEIHVRPGYDAATLVRMLRDAPCAAHLRAIVLRAHADEGAPIDLAPAMKVLATIESLRSLGLVDERAATAKMLVSMDYTPEPNLVTLGELGSLWPRLEHLRLVVADSFQLELGTVNAPALKTLVLESLRYADGWLGTISRITDRLAAARWPALERFELRLVEGWLANLPREDAPYLPLYSTRHEREDDPEDAADEAARYAEEAGEGERQSFDWGRLAPVLQALRTTPLRRLALTSFASARSLVATLATHGLPSTLTELDLSDSELSDAEIELMTGEAAAVFRRLARIDVDRTRVTAAGVARLRALGPEVTWREPGGAAWRYVVGQE